MPRVPPKTVSVLVPPQNMLQASRKQIFVAFAINHAVKWRRQPPMSAVVQLLCMVKELFGHNFLSVAEKLWFFENQIAGDFNHCSIDVGIVPFRSEHVTVHALTHVPISTQWLVVIKEFVLIDLVNIVSSICEMIFVEIISTSGSVDARNEVDQFGLGTIVTFVMPTVVGTEN
jgi:hypothetical protein